MSACLRWRAMPVKAAGAENLSTTPPTRPFNIDSVRPGRIGFVSSREGIIPWTSASMNPAAGFQFQQFGVFSDCVLGAQFLYMQRSPRMTLLCVIAPVGPETPGGLRIDRGFFKSTSNWVTQQVIKRVRLLTGPSTCFWSMA